MERVLAHELQSVFPYAVSGYKDEVDDKEDELTRHEKIILCEFVLFGLSLVGLIVGIIYR